MQERKWNPPSIRSKEGIAPFEEFLKMYLQECEDEHRPMVTDMLWALKWWKDSVG